MKLQFLLLSGILCISACRLGPFESPYVTAGSTPREIAVIENGQRAVQEHRNNPQAFYEQGLKLRALPLNTPELSQDNPLLQEDLTIYDAEFGKQSQGSWQDWGGDFYGIPGQGVTLHNPSQKLAPVQASSYKTKHLPITGSQWLRLHQVLELGFFSKGSFATVMILFNDAQNTVWVGPLLYGDPLGRQDIFIEGFTPADASAYTLQIFVQLAPEETGSLRMQYLEIAQTQSPLSQEKLYTNPFDVGFDGAFGPQSPSVDSEFGLDFNIKSWGKYKALSFEPPPLSTQKVTGGVSIKQKLPAHKNKLGARIFVDPAFEQSDSFVLLEARFFDASGQFVTSWQSPKTFLRNTQWLKIPLRDLPRGATQVEMIPLVETAPGEKGTSFIKDLEVFTES